MDRTTTDADRFEHAVLADLDALTVAEPQRPRAVEPLAGDVPVHTGPQAEGDVLILPTEQPMPHWAQPLPNGRPVVLIQDGNGHNLRAIVRGVGRVRWARVSSGLALAVVDIDAGPLGTDAVLLVEQPGGGHAPLAIGPGRYELRRQRQVRTSRPARPHVEEPRPSLFHEFVTD